MKLKGIAPQRGDYLARGKLGCLGPDRVGSAGSAYEVRPDIGKAHKPARTVHETRPGVEKYAFQVLKTQILLEFVGAKA